MRTSLCVIACLGAFALSAAAQTPEPTVPPVSESTTKVSAFLPESGWVVLPIVICLLGTIFLIYTAVARMRPERIGPVGHEETVRALLRQGDFAGADAFCRTHPSSLTKILRVGIGLISSGQQAVREGLRNALATEQLRLQTRFSYLQALAICTPLLGFLGTLGSAVRALVAYQPGDPNLLPALGAALVPTGVGLLAGIVAAGAYFILRERASGAILRLREASNSMFRTLPYESLAGLDLGRHE